MKDLIGKIMAYEDGELSEDETIELFQYLVDSGAINGLQGSYQRTARDLAEQGLVTLKGQN